MHNALVRTHPGGWRAPSWRATIWHTAKGVTLGEGPGSLLGPDGTALVIHADPDDERSDPAGNAGARIACGVVEKH